MVTNSNNLHHRRASCRSRNSWVEKIVLCLITVQCLSMRKSTVSLCCMFVVSCQYNSDYLTTSFRFIASFITQIISPSATSTGRKSVSICYDMFNLLYYSSDHTNNITWNHCLLYITQILSSSAFLQLVSLSLMI